MFQQGVKLILLKAGKLLSGAQSNRMEKSADVIARCCDSALRVENFTFYDSMNHVASSILKS